MYKLQFLMIALVVLSFNGMGQSAVKDSTYFYPEHNELIKNFNAAIGLQSRLYNGIKYTGYDRFLSYDHIIKGNANYRDLPAPVTGTVKYEGYVYANIPLLYDLSKDKLVTILPDHVSTYSLINDHVNWFIIQEHTFININADTLSEKSDIKSGFYDVLYAGKISVLAKRSKRADKTGNNQTLESFFVSSNYYFIEKDKHFYEVSGESSILKVLQDRKNELQSYIKDKKIKFKKNAEQSMAMLANYYDSLIK